MAQHRAALDYDFRSRLHMSVRDVLDRRVSLREASMLAGELLRDPDSHTTASVAGWSFVPGPSARAASDLFEAWVNAKRAKGTIPFHADRPWTKAAPSSAPRSLSDEDRAQRGRLEQMLGLSGS